MPIRRGQERKSRAITRREVLKAVLVAGADNARFRGTRGLIIRAAA